MHPIFVVSFPGFGEYEGRMEPSPQHRPAEPEDHAAVAREIESLRPALKSYILSLLPHPGACDDVVQETCIFLWERRTEFRPGTNFKAWAFKAAWFKALAHRRDLQRNRVVTFSEDILQRIAGAAEQRTEGNDSRIGALRSCLAELPPADLQLLRLKYLEKGSLADHARALDFKPNRVQKTLSRLRLVLRHCIETKLSRHP